MKSVKNKKGESHFLTLSFEIKTFGATILQFYLFIENRIKNSRLRGSSNVFRTIVNTRLSSKMIIACILQKEIEINEYNSVLLRTKC